MAALIETPDPPQHEHMWSMLAERVPAGLCVLRCDLADVLHTEAANAALVALVGARPGAAAAAMSRDRFADPDECNRLVGVLRETGRAHDHPVRLRRDDGGTVWVEITARGDTATDGTLQIWAVVRDVGDRRRREEQSRDVYQQLVQAEKMAALGQTMSGVAHELNNPLGAILALAERLRTRAVGTSLAAPLQTLHTEAERAARIARQLLTFARKRHTTRLMVGVNAVVSETLDLRADELARARVQVACNMEEDLPDVFADPHQLQQVLMNLFINAEQAMVTHQGGGTLTVATYATSPDEVVVSVSDTGPGMDEAVRARIFDPFFTTKDVGQGTGLGLAVVTAIVEEHGGAIQVESTPGAGATFRVVLPAAGLPVQAAVPAVAVEAVDAQFGRGLRILLADDEPALAGAVAEMLRDAGFEVTVARDGQEALTLAHAQTFDAVICDLRMPRVDGPTFYRAVEAVSPPQARRVIFVTGDVTGADAARFLDETGCRWLAKPFRLAELVRAVREVVG
jgi:signal transduction histidine kinase